MTARELEKWKILVERWLQYKEAILRKEPTADLIQSREKISAAILALNEEAMYTRDMLSEDTSLRRKREQERAYNDCGFHIGEGCCTLAFGHAGKHRSEK